MKCCHDLSPCSYEASYKTVLTVHTLNKELHFSKKRFSTLLVRKTFLTFSILKQKNVKNGVFYSQRCKKLLKSVTFLFEIREFGELQQRPVRMRYVNENQKGWIINSRSERARYARVPEKLKGPLVIQCH